MAKSVVAAEMEIRMERKMVFKAPWWTELHATVAEHSDKWLSSKVKPKTRTYHEKQLIELGTTAGMKKLSAALADAINGIKGEMLTLELRTSPQGKAKTCEEVARVSAGIHVMRSFIRGLLRARNAYRSSKGDQPSSMTASEVLHNALWSKRETDPAVKKWNLVSGRVWAESDEHRASALRSYHKVGKKRREERLAKRTPEEVAADKAAQKIRNERRKAKRKMQREAELLGMRLLGDDLSSAEVSPVPDPLLNKNHIHPAPSPTHSVSNQMALSPDKHSSDGMLVLDDSQPCLRQALH